MVTDLPTLEAQLAQVRAQLRAQRAEIRRLRARLRRQPTVRRRTPEEERAADVAAWWVSLALLAAAHRLEHGDPPDDFRPDDGPDVPIPVVRHILWTAERDPQAREWWGRLEALLRQDE